MKRVAVVLLSLLVVIGMSACDSDSGEYVRTKRSFFMGSDKVISYIKYEYDKQNNCIKDSWYNDKNELTGYYEQEYDENNNNITKKQFDKEGKLLLTTELKYDQQNRIIEMKTYYEDKQTVVTYAYTNDSYTSTSYNEDNQITNTSVVTLNDNGDILKEIISDGTDEIKDIEYNYEYDENGFLVKETFIFNGESMYETYIYDEKGNKIEATSYDENGKISGYGIYKYDKKGNLVKEESYDDADELQYVEKYEYKKVR